MSRFWRGVAIVPRSVAEGPDDYMRYFSDQTGM